MAALRLVALAAWLVAATAYAQAAPAQRPASPPPPQQKAAATLSGGALVTPMPRLQGLAAGGGLRGLNPADPAPQCRARCGSDRAFCAPGGGDDACDAVWRRCLADCRTK